MFQRFVLFSVVDNSFFLFIILCAILFVPWQPVQAAIPDRQDVLQFTASGHVLGFQPDGLYVVGSDHMFHVGFVDAFAVKPEAGDGLQNEKKDSPLTHVSYHDLWPGISLHYEVAASGIAESTWEIAAGADPHQIRLRYNAPVAVRTDGILEINYPTGSMNESAPVAWQEINGHRHPVKVAFQLVEPSTGASVVGFGVGQYDPARPLIIDPTLSWNTFMGGPGYDTGNAIDLDSQGNIYIVGHSAGTWGSPKRPFAGNGDVFVAKLSGNGTLLWNTFLGSASSTDYGRGAAVDGDDNIYIVGTSTGTWGSPVSAHAGSNDAFVAKLNSNGILLWNTFMGSTGDDDGEGIAVDGSGAIYIVGGSEHSWGSSPINPYKSDWDAFVVKLNSNGSLLWNTFMGSNVYDCGNGITVDASGNIYVTGASYATWGAPQRPYAGSREAFVAKLNNEGSRLWNTFLGSSALDTGYAVAVDSSSNVYVAGESKASWGSPKRAYSDDWDAFAAGLDANGNLQWNIFLGATDIDYAQSITVDGRSNIYVAGLSSSVWGRPTQPYSGEADCFAVKLNSTGSLQWNSFLGSSDYDGCKAIALDRRNNMYLVGSSGATWGSPKNSHQGRGDAFVAKLRSNCSFYIFRSKDGKTTAVCL